MDKQKILKEFYKMRKRGEYHRLIGSEELRETLEESGKTVREYFETEGAWIFDTIIYPRHKDAFFYTLDMGKHRFIDGITFCDTSEEHLLELATEFINDYIVQGVIDRDLCDFFEGNLSETERNTLYKVWHGSGYTKALITYELNHHNERFAKVIRDIIEGKNQNVYVTEAFMLGVFQSQDTQMQEELQKLLLSNAYGDSFWTAICEHSFAGSKKSVEAVLELIVQNNLLRHNSIRRAVGMNLGLAEFNTHDLEHISKALLENALDGLRDQRKCSVLLASSSQEDIYISLWCMAYHGMDILENSMNDILKHGSRTAILTMGYFLCRKDCYPFDLKIAMEAIRRYYEDKEILSQYVKFMVEDFSDLEISDLTIASDFCDLLFTLHDEMTAKGYAFPASTFPWHHLKLKPGDLVRLLFRFAAQLNKTELTDRLCTMIPEIDADHRYTYYACWLDNPKTPTQRKVLIEGVGSRQEYCRRIAFRTVEGLSLTEDEYGILEDLLRKKDDETRRNAIRLLLKQKDEALYETVSRLLADKKEEKRTAGLDLIKQLQKETKRKALYERCRLLLETPVIPTETLSGKEKTIRKGVENQRNIKLFGKEDTYQPVIEPNPQLVELFQSYFPGSKLGVLLFGQDWKLADNTEQSDVLRAKMDLKSLAHLISIHKKKSYQSYFGDVCYVGDENRVFTDEDDQVPFGSIWKEWYESEIHDPKRLVRAYILLLGEFSDHTKKTYRSFIENVFGKGYRTELDFNYEFQMHAIFEFLVDAYTDAWERSCLAQILAILLIEKLPEDLNVCNDEFGDSFCQIDTVLSWMKYHNHKEFAQVFPIKAALAEKGFYEDEQRITVKDYLFAASQALISEQAVYAYIFHPKTIRYALGDLTCQKYERRCMRGEPAKIKGTYKAAMSYRKLFMRVYHQVMEEIFEVELHRGDVSTPYSHALYRVDVIRGVSYFVQLLTALGDRPFDRSGYLGWEDDYTRTSALCVLLKATQPSKYDTVESLRQALQNRDIKTKRLIEAALYAPKWIDLIDEYLKIPGFASCCYYFIAHMKHEDLEDWLQAKISRYTPLTLDELHSGAFDLHWFQSVRKEIDEKTYKQIYQAAKYIADGSSHTRGRKFADASMGLMSVHETETLLLEKRNKDLLMAYPLIPLQDESDVLHRYMFLQDFLKESKKFGTQRRESERLAVERAIKNLAVNAGYADEIRLVLRMEHRLTDCLPLTEKERAKALKQQGLRAKSMLEQAMIDETLFSVDELLDLIKHQVIGVQIRTLVWSWEEQGSIKFDFLDEIKLNELKQKSVKACGVAHPLTMEKHKCLDRLKEELNQSGVLQPFKQIQREIYHRDDYKKSYKRVVAFSGIRVMNRRAKRILSGSRWTFDGCSGMEKTFYEQDVIAAIISRNVWRDDDFPILDCMEFYKSQPYEVLELQMVPEIVFSEAFRDMHLMVRAARIERGFVYERTVDTKY